MADSFATKKQIKLITSSTKFCVKRHLKIEPIFVMPSSLFVSFFTSKKFWPQSF